MTIQISPSIQIRVTFGVNEKHVYFVVEDSYKINTTSGIKTCVDKIREQTDYKILVNSFGYNRTRESEIREWESKNLLYKLHVARSKTRSISIDKNTSKLKRIFYVITSKLYRVISKIVKVR